MEHTTSYELDKPDCETNVSTTVGRLIPATVSLVSKVRSLRV